MEVSFEVSRAEHDAIVRLVKKAEHKGWFSPRDRFSNIMDLSACIANGCPLKLDAMEAADDTNLAHDLGGIRRHINRETGKLGDCFLPRFHA